MSTRPTIIACVLAVVGVIAAVIVARGEGGAVGSGEQAPLLAPGALPVDRVDRIRLGRRGEPTLVFERSEGAWAQIEPVGHPLDGYSIRQLAAGAAAIVPVRRLEPGEIEGDLGLDPPRAAIEYAWPGGTATLEFGRRGVAGRWYVRIGGRDRVYVATGDLYQAACEIDPREWRDRAIFFHATIDADAVEIRDGERLVRLVRDRRRWMMDEPVRSRLDEAARNELFGAMARATVDGFILDEPNDLADFGLTVPAGTLTVTATKRAAEGGDVSEIPITERLVVGAPVGLGAQDRFGIIEGRPVVVRLGEQVIRSLFPTALKLVSRTGCGVPIADVGGIVIRTPSNTLQLVRDLETWTAPEHTGTVSPDAVATLLQTLAITRAPEVEIKPYPREIEIATVTLLDVGGAPLDTVRVVREPDTGRLALENGDGVLRIFGANTAIPLSPADFGL